jgi:hypothetical protein
MIMIKDHISEAEFGMEMLKMTAKWNPSGAATAV